MKGEVMSNTTKQAPKHLHPDNTCAFWDKCALTEAIREAVLEEATDMNMALGNQIGMLEGLLWRSLRVSEEKSKAFESLVQVVFNLSRVFNGGSVRAAEELTRDEYRAKAVDLLQDFNAERRGA
jgi:hypothetical protein